jgi:hypothetical protein
MFDAATIADAQQFALERLLLKLIGDTHTIFTDLAQRLTNRVLRAAADDGVLPTEAVIALRGGVAADWRAAYDAWLLRFRGAQQQAVMLAFGQLAQAHEHYFNLPGLYESRRQSNVWMPYQAILRQHYEIAYGPRLLTERTSQEVQVEMGVFFDRSISTIVEAANARVYDDGLNLSQRLWRLDTSNQQAIQAKIAAAAANGQSAMSLARELEQHLGADAQMTRWTSDRLRLTRADITAGDMTGLITKRQQLDLISQEQPVTTRGVAYNALRLARTELKAIQASASERLFAEQPWVEGQNWTLSPAHPRVDICDANASQNPYPVGAGGIPAHPNCLCYWTAGTMSDDRFVGRMRGWLDGTQPWPEMDSYGDHVGFTLADVASGAAREVPERWIAAVLDWANSTEPEMDELLIASGEKYVRAA